MNDAQASDRLGATSLVITKFYLFRDRDTPAVLDSSPGIGGGNTRLLKHIGPAQIEQDAERQLFNRKIIRPGAVAL